MKKEILIFLSVFVLVIFLSENVYAAPPLPEFVRSVFENILNIFKVLLGEDTTTPNNELVSEILFFIIILAVVYQAAQKIHIFEGKPNTAFLVAIITSLLASRFIHVLGSEWIQSLLLPYGMLGIVATSLVPLFMLYYLLQDAPTFFRRFAWILMALVFFTLWYVRQDEVGALVWVYFFAAIITLGLFIFDGTIQRHMNRAASARSFEETIAVQIATLERDREEVVRLLAGANNPRTRAPLMRRLRNLETRIRDLRTRHATAP